MDYISVITPNHTIMNNNKSLAEIEVEIEFKKELRTLFEKYDASLDIQDGRAEVYIRPAVLKETEEIRRWVVFNVEEIDLIGG
jgi:hypothetical protein